jgi:hypothetical protein
LDEELHAGYNEIAQLPLIVKLPENRHAGQRVSALSQTIDVMPTVLDFFDCPLPPHVQGHSLRPVFEGQSVREGALFGYFGMATNYTDGRLVYMRNPVNADGGPLHAYTAMPVGGLNTWYPRDVHDKIEMGATSATPTICHSIKFRSAVTRRARHKARRSPANISFSICNPTRDRKARCLCLQPLKSSASQH